MIRQPVISSQVLSIGYDKQTHVLEVEFPRTGVYHYLDVPEDVFRELMSAQSVGSYLSRNIKPNFVFIKRDDLQ